MSAVRRGSTSRSAPSAIPVADDRRQAATAACAAPSSTSAKRSRSRAAIAVDLVDVERQRAQRGDVAAHEAVQAHRRRARRRRWTRATSSSGTTLAWATMRGEDLLLAAEVVVERRLLEPGRRGDLRHRRAGHAALAEQRGWRRPGSRRTGRRRSTRRAARTTRRGVSSASAPSVLRCIDRGSTYVTSCFRRVKLSRPALRRTDAPHCTTFDDVIETTQSKERDRVDRQPATAPATTPARQAGAARRPRSGRSRRARATDLPAGVDAADVVVGRDRRRRRLRRRASCPRGAVAAHRRRRRRRLRAPPRATTPRDPAERLNVADTVKVQWQAYLGAGAVLLSDMGRVLMTIVADTSAPPRRAVRRHERGRRTSDRYGARRRSTARTPTVRELLAVAAAKHGLDRRDLPPGINLFKSVGRRRRRRAARSTAHPRPARAVELRAELDVLVLLANVPHPLDDRPDYTASTGAASRPGAATRPRRRPAGAASTPRAAAGVREHRRAACSESPAMTDAVVIDEVVAARAPLVGRRARPARRCASSTSAATRPSTACSTTPTTPPSATRRPTRSSPRATSSSSPAAMLRSNEGSPMMTIADTTCAYHDTIGGACSRESNTLRYGHHTRHQHACVDNFLAAGARHGLGKRDLVSNINWFMNVPGRRRRHARHRRRHLGARASPSTLRAEMDVLVLISNCPQINNPCNGFDPTPDPGRRQRPGVTATRASPRPARRRRRRRRPSRCSTAGR